MGYHKSRGTTRLGYRESRGTKRCGHQESRGTTRCGKHGSRDTKRCGHHGSRGTTSHGAPLSVGTATHGHHESRGLQAGAESACWVNPGLIALPQLGWQKANSKLNEPALGRPDIKEIINLHKPYKRNILHLAYNYIK